MHQETQPIGTNATKPILWHGNAAACRKLHYSMRFSLCVCCSCCYCSPMPWLLAICASQKCKTAAPNLPMCLSLIQRSDDCVCGKVVAAARMPLFFGVSTWLHLLATTYKACVQDVLPQQIQSSLLNNCIVRLTHTLSPSCPIRRLRKRDAILSVRLHHCVHLTQGCTSH